MGAQLPILVNRQTSWFCQITETAPLLWQNAVKCGDLAGSIFWRAAPKTGLKRESMLLPMIMMAQCGLSEQGKIFTLLIQRQKDLTPSGGCLMLKVQHWQLLALHPVADLLQV